MLGPGLTLYMIAKGPSGEHMTRTTGLKPGEPAPRSGQYRRIGPRGGKAPEITAIKGKPLPPSPIKGATYSMVVANKNKTGSG
jgi:hypothetical protein